VSEVTRPAVVVLLALVAAPPVAALLPYEVGAIRLVGLSLEWWYAGAVAPILAVVVATLSTPSRE
jgi:hypothetical protein